jgi:hypothetical protein
LFSENFAEVGELNYGINFIGNGHGHWLTRRVPQPKHNVAIAGSLLFVAFLWGGNNAGTKWLVAACSSRKMRENHAVHTHVGCVFGSLS